VVLTLEKQITKSEDYKATVAAISKRYGADVSVADSARFFFTCSEIVSISSGDLQEVIQAENEAKKFPVRLPKTGVMTTFVRRSLNQVIPEGKRNSACYGIGLEQAWNTDESIDMTVARIINSPTYCGATITEKLLSEIIKSVSNGYEEANRRMQSGEESESEETKAPK
jgi:hypothetical protein